MKKFITALIILCMGSEVVFANPDKYITLCAEDTEEEGRFKRFLRLGLECEFTEKGALQAYRQFQEAEKLRSSKSGQDLETEKFLPQKELREKLATYFSSKEIELSVNNLSHLKWGVVSECLQGLWKFQADENLASSELEDVGDRLMNLFKHTKGFPEYKHEVVGLKESENDKRLNKFITSLTSPEAAKKTRGLRAAALLVDSSPKRSRESMREDEATKKEILSNCSVDCLYNNLFLLLDKYKSSIVENPNIHMIAQRILDAIPATSQLYRTNILHEMDRLISNYPETQRTLNLEEWVLYANSQRKDHSNILLAVKFNELYNKLTNKVPPQPLDSSIEGASKPKRSPRLSRSSLGADRSSPPNTSPNMKRTQTLSQLIRKASFSRGSKKDAKQEL